MTAQKKWLNLEQLLTVVPLKKSRVYYLVHVNRIPCRRIGKTLIFDHDEITAWVENNGQTPAEALTQWLGTSHIW